MSRTDKSWPIPGQIVFVVVIAFLLWWFRHPSWLGWALFGIYVFLFLSVWIMTDALSRIEYLLRNIDRKLDTLRGK